MSLLPEGENVRRAVKWISQRLQDDPKAEVRPLVNEAITRFDLTPKESAELLDFYKDFGKDRD